MKITSSTNPLIKHIVSLKESAVRADFKECVVEGIRAITTFIQAGKTLKYLLVTDEWQERAEELCSNNLISLVPLSLMKKVSSLQTPSGILGVFEISFSPSSPSLFSEPPLICAQVSDPGNLGTLIRSAAAFNKKDIILVEGVDPWNSKVIQASAGTIALVNMYHATWKEVISLKKHFNLGALVINNGSNPHEIDYKKTALIVGNEAHGLPLAWQKECDTLITLPMPGGTESLNAAIAASIMLYISYHENNK